VLTLDQPTSRELMGRAQAGDPDAFADIYRRHRGEVHGYIARRLPGAVEDLTAETFARALRYLPRWQDQGREPIGWLLVIAGNLCHSHARSVHQRIVEPREDAGADLVADPAQSDPALLAATRLDREALLAAMRPLTPVQQQAIVLHYLEDLSLVDMAQRMGRKRQAVASILMRARRAMRCQLAGVADA
jgi:RNA polymerase sigma-70 factor (ECF subfamily)